MGSPVLFSLYVNGLKLERGDLIWKQKLECKIAPLPGLQYLNEYFEKVLEQKQSKTQDKCMALQKTKTTNRPQNS